MEVNPLSIIFVKSDSKGDRLLFRYPFSTEYNHENDMTKIRKRNPYAFNISEDLLQTALPQTSNIFKGQLTGFTDEVLSTLFAVKPELCNRKFELKVNDVRFVGHPTLLPFRANKDDGTSSMILINIVFALRASASHSIVKCYYDLSKRLGKALRHEEKRCAYLSEEMKIMIAAHDEMSALDSEAESGENGDDEVHLQHNISMSHSMGTDMFSSQPKSSFDLILQRSSLARSMKTVYENLSSTGLVQVRINRWVLVSFCLPHKAHQIHNTGLVIEPETIDRCLQKLRPYHGMLLMVNPNDLLESMPLDGSPALLRLIKLYSPLKSLQTIAIEADLSLNQVFQLTGHLVYWAKATIIYPLCESNVYVVAPGANVHTESPLVERFAKDFPGLNFLQVLDEFSLPAPLWYHARCGAVGAGAGGAARLAKATAWLLRRRLLMQLHTYVQFNMSHWGGKEYYCEKHNTYNDNISASSASLNKLPTPSKNLPIAIESRTSVASQYTDMENTYPTENNLNQTNFSHTKPIVIGSDHKVETEKEHFANESDSANHSLEDSADAVDGFINPKHLVIPPTIDVNDSANENEIVINAEKKCNGTSLDSGFSSMLNTKNIQKPDSPVNGDKDLVNDMQKYRNNSELDMLSIDSGHSNKSDNSIEEGSKKEFNTYGSDKSNGIFSVNGLASEKKISLNLKHQSEMSFQPPTIISSMSTLTTCDAVDSSVSKPSGPPEPLSEKTLLASFTEEERLAIFRIPAAHNPEDLALMAQLHKKGYFRGEQHLEEIMFMENLSRSQVLQLLDKFRDVLMTYETEDPAIVMLYSNH